MKTYEIVYKQLDKYSAIIYATSLINPINEINNISVELRKHLSPNSYVLFDLLLSNGENFNRFADLYYNDDKITLAQVDVTEITPEALGEINSWYKGKYQYLNHSVLSPSQRFNYVKSVYWKEKHN